MTGERIIGKVAKITSDRELIINRGSDHGVEPGMYFLVKGGAIDVTDPDTGESLGSVSPIKVVVQAEEVSDRFAIARTFRSRRVKVSDAVEGAPMYEQLTATTTSLARALRPPRPAKYEVQVETLRLDPRHGEPIPKGESIVDVGDVVESVLDNEDINPQTTTLFR